MNAWATLPKKNMTNHLIESERDIQNVCLIYLNSIGIWAWRNNSGMVVIGEVKKRMVRVGMAGLPDILGVCGPIFKNGKYLGKFIGVEVKRPKKTTTSIQDWVIAELKKFGAIVFVTHSLSEMQEQLKSL